uniref:hypothetical protein n=1 Tax=Pseudomonas sp. TaxID=306 RepID=UPI002582D850
YILAGAERQAELEAAKAAFVANGGRVSKVPGFCPRPAPARKNWIDPETVLQRKRRRPSPADRVALRRMADEL